MVIENERPKVGVEVIVRNQNGEVLLHERKNNKGNWVWDLPGGHLEMYEEIESCASRETFEETGLTIKNIRIGKILNNIDQDAGKHYVCFYMDSILDKGEAKIMEPEKCREMKWFKISDFPVDMFEPFKKLVDTGYFN